MIFYVFRSSTYFCPRRRYCLLILVMERRKKVTILSIKIKNFYNKRINKYIDLRNYIPLIYTIPQLYYII